MTSVIITLEMLKNLSYKQTYTRDSFVGAGSNGEKTASAYESEVDL
jgi:hypothetical protein